MTEAEPELENIIKYISICYRVILVTPLEQYSKMPEYFQVRIEFETESMNETQFLEMIAGFSPGWHARPEIENEKWGVWNQNGSQFFVSSKVDWACIAEITTSI